MGRAWRRFMHGLVLVLVLPLALSSALPVLARVCGGPAVHVCHCEARGGVDTCACPICNPDRDDLAYSEESIRGECGDRDRVFGAALGAAVAPPAGFAILPPELVAALPSPRMPRLPSLHHAPPTPPPRLTLA
jgi:hypothetical protein